MRAIGQWNQAWDPFYHLDPKWTDEFFALAIGMFAKSPLPPKEIESLCIAFSLGVAVQIAGRQPDAAAAGRVTVPQPDPGWRHAAAQLGPPDKPLPRKQWGGRLRCRAHRSRVTKTSANPSGTSVRRCPCPSTRTPGAR